MSDGCAGIQLAGVGAVADVEEKLQRFYGKKYALCVSSATSGLLAGALALNLRGAEFVVSPYGWGGTIGSWMMLGNRPRFADVDPQTLALDAGSAGRQITARTRAILAVDADGVPADSAALRSLADAHGLWYVADAAQSLGAFRAGKPAGALADIVAVSFTCGKAVDAGEGGAVLTDNAGVYERMIWHTQHPARQRRELGVDNEFALNARIHPWAARRAAAVFDGAVERVAARTAAGLELIDILNRSGLTEPLEYRKLGISPSFFRLTAAWRADLQPVELDKLLTAAGWRATLSPVDARLLYRQAAFQALGSRFPRPSCPHAERQTSRRFWVRDFVPGGLS